LHLQGPAWPLRLHTDDLRPLGSFEPDLVLADRHVLVPTKLCKPIAIRRPARRIVAGPEIDVVQGVGPLELVQGRHDARRGQLNDVAGRVAQRIGFLVVKDDCVLGRDGHDELQAEVRQAKDRDVCAAVEPVVLDGWAVAQNKERRTHIVEQLDLQMGLSRFPWVFLNLCGCFGGGGQPDRGGSLVLTAMLVR
jgi:hypothetical protein